MRRCTSCFTRLFHRGDRGHHLGLVVPSSRGYYEIGEEQDMRLQVEVEAPCDMNEGFTFLISTSSGEEVAVTVPQGGVLQGQIIGAVRTTGTLIRPSSILSFTNLATVAATATNSAATINSETTPLVGMRNGNTHRDSSSGNSSGGAWKTPLWNCCSHGLSHALCAFGCPHFLAAQVMTRLRLDWMGLPVINQGSCHLRSYGAIATMVGVFWLLSFLVFAPYLFKEDDISVDDKEQLPITTLLGRTISKLAKIVYLAVGCMLGAYTVFILAKLRHIIRHKYQIPSEGFCACDWCRQTPDRNSCVDDVCTSMWCSCCVASQLALQTADVTPSRCCSPYNTINDENSTATENSSRCDSPSSLTNVL